MLFIVSVCVLIDWSNLVQEHLWSENPDTQLQVPELKWHSTEAACEKHKKITTKKKKRIYKELW